MTELVKEFPIANITGVHSKPEPSSPFDAIVASIADSGVLSPVVIHKETSSLITGHSRVLACKQLEMTTIPAWLIDSAPDSPEAQLCAIESDLIHKWFTELQENVLLAKQKKLYLQVHPETAKGVAGANAKHGAANEISSFAKTIAKNMKVSQKQIENKISIGEKLSLDVLKELENPTVKAKALKFETNQQDQLMLVKHSPANQLKVIQHYLGTADSPLPNYQGIKNIKQAEQAIKYEALIHKYGILSDASFPFINDSFANPDVVSRFADKSIRLIATDMPYAKDNMHLLEPLFNLYTPKLTDDGHIAIMYGQDSLPWFWSTVLPLLKANGLVYRGEMADVTPPGAQGADNNFGLMIHHWKPIALFAKPHKFRNPVNDVIYGNGKNEKDYYEWQQKVSTFAHVIKPLTEPGQLVVDLMMGSGTTGIAALMNTRRFFGIELKEAIFETAKTRFVEQFPEQFAIDGEEAKKPFELGEADAN